MKDKLNFTLILTLLEGTEGLVVYYHSSYMGTGCVLMPYNRVVDYASKQLKIHKRNYVTHDLELVTMVCALKI